MDAMNLKKTWVNHDKKYSLTVRQLDSVSSHITLVHFAEVRHSSSRYTYCSLKKFYRLLRHEKYVPVEIEPGDLVILRPTNPALEHLNGKLVEVSGINSWSYIQYKIKGLSYFFYPHQLELQHKKQ